MTGYVVLKAGEVPNVELHAYLDATLAFEVTWWADEARTVPVTLAGAEAKVLEDDEVVLDLAPTLTGGGVGAKVSVDPVTLEVLRDREALRWFLTLTSADVGEVRMMARGSLRVHR